MRVTCPADWHQSPSCTISNTVTTNNAPPTDPRLRIHFNDSSLIDSFSYGSLGYGHFPLPDNFPSFLHGVRHPPPFHQRHPPIYNIKRSTVNMYKIDRGIDRLGSVSKKNRFNSRRECPGWGGTLSLRNCPRKCPGQLLHAVSEQCPPSHRLLVLAVHLQKLTSVRVMFVIHRPLVDSMMLRSYHFCFVSV